MFWWVLLIIYEVDGMELNAQFIVKDAMECDKLIRSELIEAVRKTHPTADAFCEETDVLWIRPRARPRK
tara:strand:- start:825 stop:1031 length:207 start_codon:yes stop_codon:yes gene_type:complete